MHIQVIYDNGDYETFDTPALTFEEGRYAVENNFLQLNDMLFAPTGDAMSLMLERCYWTYDEDEDEDKEKEKTVKDFSESFIAGHPAQLLTSEELEAVLAIIVDGICMVARCEGKLRSWLDPEFENPMLVGFDVEKMTGGWSFPETVSVSRREGVNFKPSPRQPIRLQDNKSEEVAELEELYPGVNEDEDEAI